MKDDHKTKKQLVHELTELRSKNAAPKKSITGSISAELAVEEARRYAESIVETIRKPLLVLDADLKIISANRSFYRTFKATSGETLGCFIYELGNKQWDIPKLRELLEEVLLENKVFNDFEVTHDFQDSGHRVMLLNARQIYRKDISAKIILLALEDITELEQLKSLLTETEERYRRLFETASDGIVLLEKREGNITHVNPATENILGYSKKESIGNKLQDIGVLLDIGDFQTTMQNLNKIGIIYYNDVQVKTKSGQHINTDIYLVDKASLVQCNIREITERKQAEEALQKSEEKYQTIIETMQEGYTELDLKGNFTLVNDKVVRDLGYTKEELIGTNSRRYRDGKNEEEIYQRYNELYKTGETIRALEVVYVSKNGIERTYELTASLIRDEQGKPIGFRAVSRDITERKQAEEALRQSEEKYRTIIETIQEGYFEIDLAGNFTFVNDAQCKITGTPREQLLGKNNRDYTSEKEGKRLYQIYSRIYRTGEPEKGYAFEFTRRDGTKAFHEVSASLMRDAKGKPIGFRGVSRDVTERRQAAEALQESEKKYRELYDFLPIPVYEMDLEANITSVNRAIYETFGGTEEDLKKGFKAWQILSLEDIDKSTENIQRLLKGEQIGGTEYTLTRLDGSVFPAIVISSIIYSDGKPVGLRGAIVDITERKRTEEALRKSEENFRLSLDDSPLGIRIMSVKGETIYANRAILDIYGYDSIEELNGTPLKERYTPESYADFQIRDKKRRRGDGPSEYEISIIRKNGEVRNLQAFRKEIFWNGVKQFQVIYRDITEHKRAEKALQESQKELQILMDAAPIGICWADTKGNIEYANRKFRKLFGYSVEDIPNINTWRSLAYPDPAYRETIPSLFNLLTEAQKQGKDAAPIEMTITCKDGSTRQVMQAGTLVSKRILAIYADITERKYMENELRESEEKYRNILENMGEGYYEVALNGNFTFLNDSMCRIWGYPKKELMGINYRQYTDAEHVKRVFQTFNKVYRTGQSTKESNWQIIRKNGTKRFVEASISLLKDSSDKTTGFGGIIRDITESKLAEEKLLKSEAKYRRLIEDAQEGIHQLTPEGKYLSLNPALARMIGYDSPEEVMATITDIGQQIYVNPDDSKKLLELVNEKDSVTDFETEYYKKDGSRIWVSINMHAVRDDQGRILYYQGINQDITEKKKIEVERRENIERLRKALGATINAVAVTVETKDPYTAGHQRRVADLARAIAAEMNLTGEQIDGVRMVSMIHDIGKISIPSEILSKPTKLTNLEFRLIKTHSQLGHDILKEIEFPWPVANIILQHHERMDGSGYPQGLKGDDIFLDARIIAVADVVESMASHRPYRPALGIEPALEEIEKNKGILYDNTVADACLKLFREKDYQLQEI